MASEEVVNVEEDQLTMRMRVMNESVDTLTKTLKVLANELKLVQKEVSKMKPKKRVKKDVDPDAPRRENALEKPVVITEELCDFLGLNRGELYSRQTVTKTINKYVKDHDLQNPENRRFILLDSEAGLKLKALLRDPDQPLTFFNIQRYLKPHYPKSDSDVPTSTEVPPVKDTKVVADAAVVEDTPPPVEAKKKVVKKVVRKQTTPAAASAVEV
mgnify:CR=1 FL=1